MADSLLNPSHTSFPRPLVTLVPRSRPLSFCLNSPLTSRRWPALNRRALVVIGYGSLLTGIAAGALTVAAGALAASMAVGNAAQEASIAVKRGMDLFVQGDVEGSMVEFDKALELDLRQKPYLWQRGLSLYYLNRFEEGATQFREDVAVNPNDTEEAIWCFLCEAQLYGVETARKQFLEVGPDRRPVMRKAYELFRDGGNPEELMVEAKVKEGSEFFYAALYRGLYHEAQKNSDAAKAAIIDACRSTYGLRSGDYMALLARVHCKRRGWEL